MFIDWLTVHQDYDFRLPLVGDRALIVLDTDTGEELQVKCPTISHEGSYSTNIQIRISGNRLTVSGNPSRIDRLENLFGFTSIDQCIAVYNRILKTYGLPEFTKCTKVFYRNDPSTDAITDSAMRLLKLDDSRRVACSDGAVLTEIHITTNRAVGQGNGWVPINDGLNCAPGGNASSAAGASSAPPASSAAAASSTPASTPASTPTSSPSSTPSDGGDDSGSGDGGGGGSGSGGNSGNDGTGSGSASSSNSSGAGSGSGSGGSGECDPTSPDYLDCISRDTGDEGEGLDEVNQKDYGLNIGDRLQQARDDYTDRLNQIQDEFSQSVSVSLGSGSGSLPRNTVTLYGESVEMGIYARRDFFDAIRWIFLAVATVLSLYIVLSR